jgi:hypothetical protein
MTDEKKPEGEEDQKHLEDEVDEEHLDDVAGGFLERFPNVPLEEVKPQVKDIPPIDMGSGGEDR